MAAVTHGDRATYQAGCHCGACKAGEAAYRAALRSRAVPSKITFGQLVSAVEARRLVRALQTEGCLTTPAIAAAVGVSTRTLALTRPTITWRTTLKLRWLARTRLRGGQ